MKIVNRKTPHSKVVKAVGSRPQCEGLIPGTSRDYGMEHALAEDCSTEYTGRKHACLAWESTVRSTPGIPGRVRLG